MVNNQGDGFSSPRPGATWDPFQMANWLINLNGGGPNYLLTGMILQVLSEVELNKLKNVFSKKESPQNADCIF